MALLRNNSYTIPYNSSIPSMQILLPGLLTEFVQVSPQSVLEHFYHLKGSLYPLTILIP